MPEPSPSLLVALLQTCARRAPEPCYPAELHQAVGADRDELDAGLDRLRLAGLLRLTDWQPGRGQGYTVTPEGQELAEQPRLLEHLRHGRPVPMPPPVSAPAEDAPTPWQRGEEVRAALLDPRPPRVTLTLIALNLLVFVGGAVLAQQRGIPLSQFVGTPNAKVLGVLHDTGAISRADIYPNGEWWRLISCCFVHIGLLHLAVNMYSLWVVGPLLERMWGPVRYTILYLLTGLVGSSAMVALFPPQGFGAGASGALWGLMAAMGAWVVLNRRYLPPQLASAWLRSLGFVLLLNVFITFSVPSISASAHFGGGIAGLLLAVPLEYVRYGRGWQRLLAGFGLFLIPAVALAWVEQSFAAQRAALDVERYRSVRQRLGTAVYQAREAGDLDVMGVINPLLRKDPQAWLNDPAQKERALATLEKARRVLDRSAATLADPGRLPDATAERAVKDAQQYVKDWTAYLDRWSRILDDRAAYTPAEKQALEALQEQIRASDQRVRASPVFTAQRND